MNLTLVLNHRCNLRCRYCYTGRKFERAMPLDLALRAVDFGLQTSKTGHLTLSFFGGEPLMEIDAMEAIVPYTRRRAEERKMTLAFSLSTNATVLDDRRLAFLRENHVHVQVSMDGVPAAQNQTRPYTDGSPSHDEAAANLQRLVQAQLVDQVVAVMDPANIAHLTDSYRHLDELGAPEIYFAPNFLGDWNPEACELFEAKLSDLADAYLETFRQGRVVRMDPLYGKIVSHLILGKQEPRRCGFGAEELAVAPSGRIYPCDRMVREDDNAEMCLGHVDTGLDQDRCAAIQTARRRVDPECEACELFARCSQWCGCAQWETTRTLGTVSPLFCWFERTFIAQADRVANTLFAERNPTFLREFYSVEPVAEPRSVRPKKSLKSSQRP